MITAISRQAPANGATSTSTWTSTPPILRPPDEILNNNIKQGMSEHSKINKERQELHTDYDGVSGTRRHLAMITVGPEDKKT